MVDLYSVWPPNIFRCDKGNDTTDKELIAYQLVEEKLIYNREGVYIYDSIHAVNKRATEIVRQKVKELEPTINATNLNMYYAPMEILRQDFPNNGCTLCLNGVDLEKWG